MPFALSPGVTVIEKDFSSIIPAVSTSAGATAGVFSWGPVSEPTTVTSEDVLVELFGKPNDSNFKSFFTAANFLSYTNNLIVNRVDTTGLKNAVVSATGEVLDVTFLTTGSGFKPGHNTTVTFSAPQTAGGETATGTVVLSGGAVTGFTISANSGYVSTPTVTISAPEVEGGQQALATATVVNGVVTEIIVDNIGSGYTNAFVTLQNKPGDTTGGGAQGEPVLGSVYDYYMYESTSGFNEEGYVNAGDYWDYNWSDGAYVGTIIRQFFTDSENTNTGNPAVINVSLGAVAKYPGYYKTNDGFLDDSMFIQDSRYYQAFSYVLKIDEQLQSYASVVRTMLHPSGMAMFGEYSIQNFFDLQIGFQAFVKSLGVTLFSFAYPNTTKVYYNFIKDLSIATDPLDDSVMLKTLSKDLGTETVTPSHDPMGTLNTAYIVFDKSLAETVTESETTTLDIGLNWDNADDKPVASHDTWGTLNTVFMVFSMGVPDADSPVVADDDVSLGGNVPITFTKYNEETSIGTFVESGYLFKDPYDEGGYFEDLTYNAGLQQQF